jgi:hypothetical protein
MYTPAVFLGAFGGCVDNDDDDWGRSECFGFDRSWGSKDNFGGGFWIFIFSNIFKLSIRDIISVFVAFLMKSDFGSFSVDRQINCNQFSAEALIIIFCFFERNCRFQF